MTRIAIIPARGGSKRLPRKNILPFDGQPMLYWTVKAALESHCFEHVLFTSDDDEYLKYAEAAGAEIIKRPSELAQDNVTLIPVVSHILSEVGQTDGEFCMLMPNCPLRDAMDIQQSYDYKKQLDADFLMSVTSYNWLNPEWVMKLGNDGELMKANESNVFNENNNLATVCPTGAIRWCNTSAFLAEKQFYGSNLKGFNMPWYKAVDIDTREDFNIAHCVAFARKHGFNFEGAA